MRTIPYCDIPDCWQHKLAFADRWFVTYWAAVSVATFRARSTGRRQQVRRGDVGWGRGWLVQEIR